jgi:hypothetical protein
LNNGLIRHGSVRVLLKEIEHGLSGFTRIKIK